MYPQYSRPGKTPFVPNFCAVEVLPPLVHPSIAARHPV